MEITDYLAIARRRWMLLIGVPLLAAVIAGVVLFTAPVQYTATATVNAPALVGGSSGQYTGSQAVTQFVSAFQSTAASAPVDDAVRAQTTLQPGQIEDGLAVTQIGGSSAVSITFTGTKNGEPTKVVSTVASATLKQMFDSQVTLGQARVDQARKDVSAANAAINAWGAKNNMVDPTRVYQAQLERLSSLQQSQASLKAQGNDAAASALSGTITEVNNSLKGYGPKIAEFNDLSATRDSAQADLTTARQNLAQAKTQQTAADPSQVVWVSGQRKLERTDEVVSVGLPVLGAGIFLALALIAVLELWAAGRRSSGRGRHSGPGATTTTATTTATTPEAQPAAAAPSQPATAPTGERSDTANAEHAADDSDAGDDGHDERRSRGALVGTERS
ncbi:subunit length determinant protein [Terracoccus luteus]|uniref:Subunit length determinant protein n=1 Tax=Terracoccus luteus TaxID=53356 RepID=A0A495XW00_9MICO|nr:Wzz/FepE/Etk N-terminal domain-containing protein [Terracoccus luteus]RKT78447.1 subunit length determinant protein [Terracoccus luteus]